MYIINMKKIIFLIHQEWEQHEIIYNVLSIEYEIIDFEISPTNEDYDFLYDLFKNFKDAFDPDLIILDQENEIICSLIKEAYAWETDIVCLDTL